MNVKNNPFSMMDIPHQWVASLVIYQLLKIFGSKNILMMD